MAEMSSSAMRAPPEKMEALKVTFEKKKECEAKALCVVDSMLENPVTTNELLAKCSAINNSYYDDLIEERAIAGLCGYPVCGNKLKKNTSSQQYHISVRFNKVFDTVQRKRFCSNLCFKASQFLESQLPTCPVWLLDQERPRDLKLYSEQVKILGLGKEVVLEDRGVKDELVQSKMEFEKSANDLSKKVEKIATKDSVEAPHKAKKPDNNSKCPSQAVVLQNARPTKLQQMPLSRLEVIEQSIKQWMTLDTLWFLLGPERYQNALAGNGLKTDEVDNLAGGRASHMNGELAQKYAELCRKLDLEAIADHAMDSKLVQDVKEENEKKGLPSYECLSKEAKRFSLNVQAFYKGKMELLKEDADVEEKKTAPTQSTPIEKVERNSAPMEFSSPLVDNHAQRALRRRIVLDKLNRVNHTVLQAMDLSPRNLSAELRQLVATFNLAVKINSIQLKLHLDASQRCMATLLQTFNKQVDYLTQLVNSLMDVGNLLNKPQ